MKSGLYPRHTYSGTISTMMLESILYIERLANYTEMRKCLHSQKKEYYYSYIGNYLKAVRAITEIWNSILCFYRGS